MRSCFFKTIVRRVVRFQAVMPMESHLCLEGSKQAAPLFRKGRFQGCIGMRQTKTYYKRAVSLFCTTLYTIPNFSSERTTHERSRQQQQQQQAL